MTGSLSSPPRRKMRSLDDPSHSRPPYSHPPSRQSSVSRRHASLGSPREIPLPASSLPDPPSFEPPRLLPGRPDRPLSGLSRSSPTDTLVLSDAGLSLYSAPRMPHTFLGSRSVSESSATVKSIPASPATSDPPGTSHQEKPGDTMPARTSQFPYADSQPKSHPNSLSQPGNRIDQGLAPSLPLLQTFHGILPMTASTSEHSLSRDDAFQGPSGEAAKRRPLPLPPSSSPRTSDPIPSSPPPPYSRFLPQEDLARSTHDLSSSSSSTTLNTRIPEAPVIMTPSPNEQGAEGRPPYDTFLCHSPPANTWIVVETSQSEYILLVRLPGFRRDGITIATRRRRILHIVADSWEPEGGHFERRVSFGHDAELALVRAEFDGEMLRVVVPRRMSAFTS